MMLNRETSLSNCVTRKCKQSAQFDKSNLSVLYFFYDIKWKLINFYSCQKLLFLN